MSKLVYIDIDVIPNGATIQTEVRKQIKRFLWAPVVKDNCNRILIEEETQSYFYKSIKKDKSMDIQVDLDINADVALSAFVEVERKGYADNVFAQMAQLYSKEKLLHWAQLLTTRPANHTAGNIDTAPAEPAEIDADLLDFDPEDPIPEATKNPALK